MLQNNQKEVYSLVKSFKDLYSELNMNTDLYLSGTLGPNTFNVEYIEKSVPYTLKGTVKSSNDFVAWLYNEGNPRRVLLTYANFKRIKGCLKKNVVSYENKEDCFVLSFKENDTAADIIFNNLKDTNKQTINTSNDLMHIAPLSNDIFSYNLIELYLTADMNVTEEKTNTKLLEVASTVLKVKLDNPTYTMYFSDINPENKTRHIRILSANADKTIALIQDFLTI